MAAKTQKKGFDKETLARAMPVLTIVAALGYAAAAYFLLFVPKFGMIVPGGKLDLQALTQIANDDEAYLARVRKTANDFKTLNPERRDRVVAMIPLEPDVPGAVVQAEAAAAANTLLLTSIDAVPDDKAFLSGKRRVVRMSAMVSGGGYAQLKGFLTDLERSLRLFDVAAIVFTPGSGDYNVVMRAYYLNLAAPEPTAATQVLGGAAVAQ